MNVITAGGAGNGGGKNKNKNKKKRNRKKSSSPVPSASTPTASISTSTSTTAPSLTPQSNGEVSSSLPSSNDYASKSNEYATKPSPLPSSSPEEKGGLNDETTSPDGVLHALELEESTRNEEDNTTLIVSDNAHARLSNPNPPSSILHNGSSSPGGRDKLIRGQVDPVEPLKMEDLYQEPPESSKTTELFWLFFCFLGIMASFVCYGLLLEYTTSGGRKLHELSFLFVTSGLYTLTAAAGRYVRAETPTTIPPARFAVLGLTSMGSTFCSVRSLRYVIYPIQVLAKSCKPVPVMLMGALMGKRYNLKKYINVVLIVFGVALFMGGGDSKGGGKKSSTTDADDENSTSSQFFGILLLFVSLCFDGGTGAYEDKLMSVHSVQPFDLMYNIQLGKTILAGVSLLVLNQLHIFVQMCQEMGLLLVALGLSGALGQVFIFVTIAKFGALTCSIIGLSRKVTTLVASIYFYGHHLNGIQFTGLCISVGAMVLNFMGKSKKGGGGHGHGEPPLNKEATAEEMQSMIDFRDEPDDGDVELAGRK